MAHTRCAPHLSLCIRIVVVLHKACLTPAAYVVQVVFSHEGEEHTLGLFGNLEEAHRVSDVHTSEHMPLRCSHCACPMLAGGC